MKTLPPLPWRPDALQPYISAETISFHYEKHHRTYLNNLNKLIEGTEYEHQSLEEIIKHSTGPIFNNAAQLWNHTFYWESLAPEGMTRPSEKLTSYILKHYASMDLLKEKFSNAAITLFGSGWAWLAIDYLGHLKIIQEKNAGTPLKKGFVPILTCDVWEHAYYLDYQNRRADYVKDFWKLINWDMVEKRVF